MNSFGQYGMLSVGQYLYTGTSTPYIPGRVSVAVIRNRFYLLYSRWSPSGPLYDFLIALPISVLRRKEEVILSRSLFEIWYVVTILRWWHVLVLKVSSHVQQLLLRSGCIKTVQSVHRDLKTRLFDCAKCAEKSFREVLFFTLSEIMFRSAAFDMTWNECYSNVYDAV